MSLRPLNRDPKYMSGEYANMFDIPVHQSNKGFAQNPYSQMRCGASKAVCFSLVNGAMPCQTDDKNIIVWRAMGDLSVLPNKQAGPTIPK